MGGTWALSSSDPRLIGTVQKQKEGEVPVHADNPKPEQIAMASGCRRREEEDDGGGGVDSDHLYAYIRVPSCQFYRMTTSVPTPARVSSRKGAEGSIYPRLYVLRNPTISSPR